MLRAYRFEQDCRYIEDTRYHRLYHTPAEQRDIFQVLHGALFAGTALYGAVLGPSIPSWLAVSVDYMLVVLLKLYEHRVSLPRFSCVKRLLKQMNTSYRQHHKLPTISGLLIVSPLLILWSQTYQNPVVATLAPTVTGISVF